MGVLDLFNPTGLRNAPAMTDVDSGFWDQFGKGLNSSVTGTHAGLRGMAGTAAEALGADEFAQREYQLARELQAQAQAVGGPVASYKEVHRQRDGISYLGSTLGGSAPSLALGMGAGMVAKTALGGLAAGTLAQTPIEAADVALKQLNDPGAMEQSAGERFARQIGGGGLSAGLQTVVPNIVGGKLVGRGAQQAATQSLKQIAGRNAMAIPSEGVFEGASEGLKQMATSSSCTGSRSVRTSWAAWSAARLWQVLASSAMRSAARHHRRATCSTRQKHLSMIGWLQPGPLPARSSTLRANLPQAGK